MYVVVVVLDHHHDVVPVCLRDEPAAPAGELTQLVVSIYQLLQRVHCRDDKTVSC